MVKNSYIYKKIAILLIVVILNQTFAPAIAYCLTSGPSQPEFSGFQQAGVTDMVDMFSGDFMYNLPLADVDGFPINISYNSNPRMDDEASWVGLGWSLNPGSISRSLRGIPDDFAGEGVTKKTSMAQDMTVGIDGAVNAELFGWSGGKLSIGVGGALSYNTKRGFDFTTSLSFNPIVKIGSANTALNTNLGLSSSSANGLNMNASVGLGSIDDDQFKSGATLGAGLNSRQGLKSLTFQTPLPIKDPFLSGMASYMGAGSITHNFGPFSYTPTSSLPISNESISFSGKGGGEIFGGHPNFKIGGFWARQYLTYNTETQVSYGYLHLEEGQDNDQALLDYNAEVAGQIKENTPNLPLIYGTYDVFSVAGQGIGGAFRAVRNDVGLFRPGKEINTSVSGNIGAEFGGGNAVHGGGDIFVSNSNSVRGAWNDPQSQLTNNLKFREGTPSYKNFYFKFANDNSKFANDVYSDFGGEKALYLSHQKSGSELIPNSKWLGHGGGSYQMSGDIKNDQDAVTNNTVRYLTGAEAAEMGVDKSINSYPRNIYAYGDNCGSTAIDEEDRVGPNAPAHHLSEFTVLQSDGGRYVYGLPVKNIRQHDASFNVTAVGNENQGSSNYGLVQYNNSDNGTNNNAGREKYYESNDMPSYAHSFLLTNMLSADYVDKTGDGVTDDDLGTAIKLNYHLHDNNFKWRIPTGVRSAQFHKGYNSTSDDNKASFVYGEKELWYVHSIESRTKVAQFFTSPRQDGLGVAGIDGGKQNSETVLKLDSIQILTKSELANNPNNPVPLKTVHFTYDYSLCKGVANQVNTSNGKLTLKSIHYTYQNSERGALSPYKFAYKAGPNYNMGLYNRWGLPQVNPSNYPHIQEYPYVIQGADEQATANAGAWSLNGITLPTGATIAVNYEPDDYAYVQNKRAGQMMEVVGFTNNSNGTGITSSIYNGPGNSNKYVAVNLPYAVNTANTAELKKRYFEDVGDIYFDMKVNMNGSKVERIKGYFKIDPALDIVAVSNTRVLIPVKYLKDSKNKIVHPIAFAGFQVLRLQLPEIIQPHMNTNNPGIAFFKSIFNAGKEIRKLFKGFEFVAQKKGWAKTIVTNNKASWIRLANPDFKKLGGNSRVQSVTISDNWTFDGAGGESVYGQRYEYTMEKEIAGNMETISSGVASYEPAMGGEENLMKQPLPYEEKYLLGPKNMFYSEAPFGESLFPAASVGYQKVKTINIANDNTALIRTQSGYTENEFYTAKEFPTRVTTSQVLPRRFKTNPILKFLKVENKELVSLSQGYTIELNDMHGKQKRMSTYDKNEQLLSRTTYNYQLEAGSGETKKLNNTVKLVEKDGSVIQKEIGVEFDLWQETFQERNVTEGKGTKISGDFFMAFIFPVIVPTLFPNSNKEETGLSSAVTTKVIHRNGVLNTVEVIQDGSKIATENVAYDANTGSVLINKTFNEHDDPIYSFTTPAYWAYPYMGHASDNLNTTIEGVSIPDGKVSNGEAQGAIRAGDELMVTINGTIQPDRVYATKSKTATQFTLMDRDGVTYTSGTPVDLKVIRSGNRNMLTGSVLETQTLIDPLAANPNQIPNSGVTQGVIAASASTYKSDFPIECETVQDPVIRIPLKGVNNPYVEGGLGQWRPFQTFSPKQLRGNNGQFTALSSNDNVGVYGTYDGVMQNYFSGWEYNTSQGRWICNLENWIIGEEITKYDRNGNALESFNALCIPTAAHFGYKNSLPTIVASNSTYAELYSEGFEEDVFEQDCDDFDYRKHFEIYKAPIGPSFAVPMTLADLNSDHAHTGKHSLEIAGNSYFYSQTSLTPCAKPGSNPPILPANSSATDNVQQNKTANGTVASAAGFDNAPEGEVAGIGAGANTAAQANPQQGYKRVCGTDFNEQYNDIVAIPSGGYMAVGTHSSDPGAAPDLQDEAFVARLNEDGEPIWVNLYGGALTDESATSIIRNANGSYVVTGSTTKVNSARRDVFILEVDINGNKIGENSFQGSLLSLPSNTIATHCVQTTGNGYIIGARKHDNSTNDYNDDYVIKVNQDLSLDWSKIYGFPYSAGNQNDAVTDILETANTANNYLVATNFRGEFGTYNALHDIGVMKLDANGDIIWEKGFGTGDDKNNGTGRMVELTNGQISIAGFAGIEDGFNPASANALDLRLDANGNKIHARGYKASNGQFNRFFGVIERNANQPVFSGWANKTTATTDFDGVLFCEGTNLNERVDLSLDDRPLDLLRATDGGYVLPGYNIEQGSTDRDLYLIKLDANGALNPNCPTEDLGMALEIVYPQAVYNTALVVADVNQEAPVNLTVNSLVINCTDDCGNNCNNQASFVYNPSPVCADTLITFTNTSTGASSYQWYINGQLQSTAENFTFTFANEGIYTVTLHAISPGCDLSMASEEITVFGQAPIGVESITVAVECSSCNSHEPTQIYTSDGPRLDGVYVPTCEGCLPLFTPEIDKDYLVSGWVASDASLATNSDDINAQIRIFLGNGATNYQTISLDPEGPVIEGWQRVSAKITVDGNLGPLERFTVGYFNTGSTPVYFDDLRIHPNICNAKSYVYDPYSARLMAELDENNYALFYEYDDEGLLVRIKRETEKGIVTIQEGRTVTKPNPYTP